MTPLAEAIEVIVKHLTDRFAMAIFLLSLICFLGTLLPPPIGDFLRLHWQYPFFGCLGMLCYLPTRPILNWYNSWTETEKQGARFKHLTTDEKKVLLPFMNGATGQQFYSGHIAAIGLQQEGILLHTYTGNQQISEYRLAPWARAYLKKHPELLK